jgi:hypothetical protein
VPARPGQSPISQAKKGDSVQNMAYQDGNSDWQSVAAANGIEDPLRLPPGQMLDLNARVGAGASLSIGAAVSLDAALPDAGAGLNGSLGGLSGSFSAG